MCIQIVNRLKNNFFFFSFFFCCLPSFSPNKDRSIHLLLLFLLQKMAEKKTKLKFESKEMLFSVKNGNSILSFYRSISLLFNNSNRQMLFEVFFGCHNFIKHSIMEFIFGLKLAKKKYDVFSYNSSSSSWILILIPVFSQQQHDSFHWLCLCLFVLSNFIWKLWKNFVFRFLFIKFRNKNLLLRYGFGDPKCWYPFLDTFDSVKCNIYLCLKECFANEQFFSVFFWWMKKWMIMDRGYDEESEFQSA